MFAKKLVRSLLTVGWVVSNLLTASPVHAQDVIKVGGNFELSGPAASYGTQMDKGARLAIKHVNESGGVLGQQVEYVVYDNRSDTTETASIARRLVDEGVVGVVGPATSGDTLAQMPVLDQAQIPSISGSATLDNITYNDKDELYEYFFRVVFEDSYQGRAAGKYVFDTLGAQRVAVVTDQALDYSLGLTDAFTQSYTEAGGEIVYTDTIQTGDTDFSAVLTSLLVQDFDVLYLPVYYTEAGLFIQQARQLGLTQPIVGGDGYHSPVLVELAGESNASDVYFTSHFSMITDDTKAQQFVADYQAEYGEEPNTFAATSYDAMRLLLDAIERAGEANPELVKQQIESTVDFVGVSGTFSIDEHHNSVKPALMLELQNGEVVNTEFVSAE